MKKVLIGVLIVLGWAVVHLPLVHAQEAAPQEATANQSAPKEDDKFSFGKVISVSEGQVVVKEYDFTKDADVDVAYSVTPETELGNVNAVADLKPGDGIVIDYFEKDGNRVITTLVKEEKTTEAMPEEEAVAPSAPVADAPVAAPEAPVEQK